MSSRTHQLVLSRTAIAFTALLAVHFAGGQVPKNPVQKSGPYVVELRVPTEGLFAGEETDIEFRVTDIRGDDPVQGPPPVVNAKTTATVTMPSMASMPAQKPRTHAEGVPGDYGVVAFFPHGGDYRLDLAIAPPLEKAFNVTFKLTVQDAPPAGKRKPKPAPYTLEVTSSPASPRAGEETTLNILVRSRDTKQPVTDFETVHEQKMHFIVVSRDLAHFSHEHPDLGSDGKFTLKYVFPTGGEYRVFADMAPRGAGSQVISQPIRVSGEPGAKAGPLKVSMAKQVVEGVTVTPAAGQKDLIAGRTAPLTFTVTDEAGGAVTDLQPWLGAMAHLILIHEDAATFVHSHPHESDPQNGHNGSLTFLARPPKPGLYKGWIQFQRGGKVLTAPFVLDAKGAAR